MPIKKPKTLRLILQLKGLEENGLEKWSVYERGAFAKQRVLSRLINLILPRTAKTNSTLRNVRPPSH
ncbi:MAG: hypothetical protein QW707_10155 [Candidatus Bathyarchaeia archaeon]